MKYLLAFLAGAAVGALAGAVFFADDANDDLPEPREPVHVKIGDEIREVARWDESGLWIRSENGETIRIPVT